MQNKLKTSYLYEIASEVNACIFSSGSTSHFRKRSYLTKNFFDEEFNKKVRNYIENKQVNEHYIISTLNPLIDMCLELGILDYNDFAYYVTLYDQKDIKKSKHTINMKSTRYSIFSEVSAKEFVHQDDTNIFYPSLFYTDNISYLFIGGKLFDILKENKDDIKTILKDKYGIGLGLKGSKN